MREFARERLAVPVKRRPNAKDAFSGRREGFRIKLSDGFMDGEIFMSREEALPFAGGQMR